MNTGYDSATAAHAAAWEAMRRGDVVHAVALAGEAVALRRAPDFLETLGQFQYLAGQIPAAIATLREATMRAPQSVAAHNALAMAQRQTSDADMWREAVDHLQAAVALAPDLAGTQLNLALMRHHVGAADHAAGAEIDRAVQLDPGDPEIWADGAAMFHDRGLFIRAMAAARRAVCLAPDLPHAMHAHAEVVAVLNGPAKALAWFDRLVRLAPTSAGFQVARGKARLAAGDTAGGWSDYEARRHMPAFGLPAPSPGDSSPQSLAGKTVVVYGEQGFGDVLQFVRFVRPLAQRAARVHLVVPDELRSLLADMPGCEGRVTMTEAQATPRGDLALPVMSLPRLLDMSPDGSPYLVASAVQRARWGQALAEARGLRIGVCWSGNPRPQSPVVMRMTDRRRSVPLSEFGPALGKIGGVTFVSLQHGYRPGEQPGAYGIRDASAYIRDFSDLAGLITNLDLVITVDTAVAHLAGALGVPTWMLNRFDSCWRWERGATTTRWYQSMTIISQTYPMNWTEPLAEMTERLHAEVRRRAAEAAPSP
jgi:Flp pilus assembly protein TadD